MFQDLDTTIKAIFDDKAAPATLLAAEVSFETPERTYKPGKATVNLFLYEVKENRELRAPAPITEIGEGGYIRKRPPIRVDCTYLVTAWSELNGADAVVDAHRLLGLALAWLSRFPTIPDTYWAGSLKGSLKIPPQPFPPPTMIAQMDGLRNASEFWNALGIAPRPYFNLLVTIALDLDQYIEGQLVTTVITGYRPDVDVSSRTVSAREEFITIGGQVRNKAGKPVALAWVKLDPIGEMQTTDDAGHFIFAKVKRGAGYTLSARASGFPNEAVHVPFEVPSQTGEYDLQFDR